MNSLHYDKLITCKCGKAPYFFLFFIFYCLIDKRVQRPHQTRSHSSSQNECLVQLGKTYSQTKYLKMEGFLLEEIAKQNQARGSF